MVRFTMCMNTATVAAFRSINKQLKTVKMKNTKHHDAVIAFVKKHPNSNLDSIREGLPKISARMINLASKELMDESTLSHNQDTGTYSFASKKIEVQTKNVKSDKKEVAKTTSKVVAKTDKKKEEADLGPKHVPGSKGLRDNTRYSFQNKHQLAKGRLILALVAQYIADHKAASVKQINEAFQADKVQKRYLVIRTKADAAKFTINKKTRFFLKDNELLTVAGAGKCAICSQWDITNVTAVINALKAKYKVTISK